MDDRLRFRMTRSLAIRLASIPSDWPAHGESVVARSLKSVLAPAGFRFAPSARPRLPVGRKNVLAYRLGNRPEAILFTGHLDTMPRDPQQREGPSRRGSRPIVRGRGILDMKAGIAAGAVACEELSRRGFSGTILYLAVADEEGDSLGMRAALRPLMTLRDRLALRIVGAVNLDFVEMSDGWTAYTGSVGKLLVAIALATTTRHASDARASRGVIDDVARLLLDLPGDPRLRVGESHSLPQPILLHAETVRDAYGVSLPGIARLELHVPFFHRSPDDVVRAVAEVTASLLGGRARVATFGELVGASTTGRNRADAPDVRIAAFHQALSRLLQSGRRGSLRACVYLAPPVYPPVETPTDEALIRALRTIAHDDRGKPKLRVGPCYPFISDLSHLRRPRGCDSPATVQRFAKAIAAHLPFPAAFTRSVTLAAALDLPVVNVGPAGHGAHTENEWVDDDVAFRRLPHVLVCLAKKTLAEFDRQ